MGDGLMSERLLLLFRGSSQSRLAALIDFHTLVDTVDTESDISSSVQMITKTLYALMVSVSPQD